MLLTKTKSVSLFVPQNGVHNGGQKLLTPETNRYLTDSMPPFIYLFQFEAKKEKGYFC